MDTPSYLALDRPGGVPDAAIARLLETSAALAEESATGLAGGWSGWLAKAGQIAGHASSLLAAAIDGTITESDAAGLINIERVSKVAANLFAELAVRTDRRGQIAAMYWATLHRRIYSDTTLTHREHAMNATININKTLASAPVRILPGAEPAVSELSRDWLVFASGWDLESLAADLLQWVYVSG